MKRNYKKEYKKFQSSPEMIKYRTRLNKENRDRGTYGNGDGMDVSHKGKTTVLEKQSVNRGRMGEGGRKRKVSVKKRRAQEGMMVKKTPMSENLMRDQQFMTEPVVEERDKKPLRERVKEFFANRKKRKLEESAPMTPIKSPVRLERETDGLGEARTDLLPKPEPAVSTDREIQEQLLGIASRQMSEYLIDPETGSFRLESDPIAKEYIEDDLFPSVGLMNRDSTKDAWSAATVSKLAKAFDPSFEGSGNHGNYINRAFNNKSGIGYTAQPIEKNTQFRVGDILFQGRLKEEKDKDGNETGKMIPAGPQEYKGFEKAARGKGKWADGYGSHTDIIVDVTTRDGKTVYLVQGGNMSDKMRLKEFTAEQLVAEYKGRLTQ